MNCKVISWNVRGMSLPQRKYGVKDLIAKWKPDVIFLQEVKLSGSHLTASLSNVWKSATFFHTLHSEDRGGAILGFSSSMSKFLIAKGEDPSHSCVWALSFINGHSIGFCYVYSSNKARECCELWDWMAKELPNADWVIGGDFNMVEYSVDRSWTSHAKLSHEEFDKWLHCRNSIGVVDPIHSKSSSHFQN